MRIQSDLFRVLSIVLVIILQSLICSTSLLFAVEIEPGQTGEVTIVKSGMSGTVSVVIVGSPIGEDAIFIDSNTSGTWSQQGSTLTIKFDVTLAPNAPVGETLNPLFMVFIQSSTAISNFPEPVTITVKAPEGVTAVFSATPVRGIAPLNVDFTNQSIGEISSWLWDFGDGSTSTDENPNHTYSGIGDYSVSLSVTGPSGTDIITKENYIKVKPIIADFSANPVEGMFPLSVDFTDESVGDVSSWLWDFGDGNTSTEQNPNHTYIEPGIFSVSLIMTGSTGSDTIIKENYINVKSVKADFSATPVEGMLPLSVDFTDQSKGDVTGWFWDFGDGNTSTEQNPTHIYNSLGTYSVFLLVSDSSGADEVIKNELVNVVQRFGAENIITTSADEATSVYASDLDGDGDIDVLSASERDDKIAWYENTDGGSFGAQQIISTRAKRAKSVYTSDLDGDGDEDVLSVSIEDDKLAWYENMGNGSFGAQQIISASDNMTGTVYATDLDGDGDQDVLSVSSFNIDWYENMSDGSFQAKQVSTVNDFGKTVYASDLDGDGDQDVLSAAYWLGEIKWYENMGDGSFGAQQIITDSVPGANSVFTADLDSDGDQDVLSASEYDVNITWYKNAGNGSFGVQQIISTNAAGAVSVYAADLDGDGDQDVLSASFDDDKLAWYENMGDGSFGAQQIISTIADGPRSVYALDLDGDGDQDVLSASFYDDKIAWFENHTPVVAPIADFSADTLGGSAPLEVNFTDKSENHVSSWSWDFGDDSTSNEKNPTHTYEKSGLFSATLTVSGNGGSDTEAKTDYILVSALAPVADFTVDTTSGNAPLEVNFTDKSENNVSSWSWDFGDGNSDNSQNPAHTYYTVGSFTVSLIVVGDGGRDTIIKMNYITITDPTGLKISQVEGGFKIYPNPTNNLFSIETDLTGYHSIEISSVNGQQMHIGEMEGTTLQMDLSSFQKGVYFITVRSKDFVTTRKIIKL